ncbi:hypothetical protein SAMD00019534_124610, partial [Acytostelium subglobosum LB1]|uniref:hypothetical protein n=1 Tax=Acytostelium subglobosum LB1 TaxID=1410327 RepID=UPI000644AC61
FMLLAMAMMTAAKKPNTKVNTNNANNNFVRMLFNEKEYQEEFSKWLERFEKKYDSFEFVQRFAIFKTNMDYVTNWNKKNSDTVLELNHLADLTNSEYRRLYLGTHVNGVLGVPGTHIMSGAPQVDSIDWRAKGAVSHIKDQGQCGSCWSFSSTGSVEGAHQIKTGNMVTLSEQNLIDCSTKQGNMGCNGGLMDFAFEYIIENVGIDTETSYPYKGENGKTCLFKSSDIGATISSYKNITSGSESELEDAALIGPVSVAIDAGHNSFQLYSSGIYYEPKCSSTNLDHGVLVVGFGSGTPPSSKVSSSNKKSQIKVHSTPQANTNYWIVKNSWGESWGDKGFIYMSRIATTTVELPPVQVIQSFDQCYVYILS